MQEELSSDNAQQSTSAMQPYLESLKESLTNIDVISVIDTERIRRYHSNHELINSVYDGTNPKFQNHKNSIYVTSDVGPSGSQRRAYAAIYDKNGNYLGFVLAVMLNQHIHRTILNTVAVHLICAVAVIFFAVILSKHLSVKIKRLLLGYEPDTFSAMFSVRENILESLEEGILAVDKDEKIIFINKAAKNILHIQADKIEGFKINESLRSYQ